MSERADLNTGPETAVTGKPLASYDRYVDLIAQVMANTLTLATQPEFLLTLDRSVPLAEAVRHQARESIRWRFAFDIDEIESATANAHHQTAGDTTTTVADAEALVDLLHDLNERGVAPSVAFIDVQGITGVAYGIDEGDDMGIAFLSDPGEDRMQHDLHSEDDASYIGLFERDVHELHGPITVLHESGGQS